MSTHTHSNTPDLPRYADLVEAMHSACVAIQRCLVTDRDSSDGLSEIMFYGFNISGATMYARILPKLGFIVTSTDCNLALAHTPGQFAMDLQKVILRALRRVGFTDEGLDGLYFVQTPHKALWSLSDADLAVELCMYISYPKLDDPSGLTCAATSPLQSKLNTLDVYWQTAGSVGQIHLPTLLRGIRRERKEQGKSLHRVLTPTGGMYSRTESTIRSTSSPSTWYTRTVQCEIDQKKYIAFRTEGTCKILHMGEAPRTVSKATLEGLDVILSAMWYVDSGFTGTQHNRLLYTVHSYAPALLVMTLTDAKGVEWIVAKHREHWAASRMSCKSRSIVVQIYT